MEGDETVVLTVAPSGGYNVGSPSTDTVIIADSSTDPGQVTNDDNRDPDHGQGQRSLNHYSGKDLQQVIVVPTTTTAFHDQAIAAGMLLQQ